MNPLSSGELSARAHETDCCFALGSVRRGACLDGLLHRADGRRCNACSFRMSISLAILHIVPELLEVPSAFLRRPFGLGTLRCNGANAHESTSRRVILGPCERK